jgi:hypothetical protein
MISGSPQSPSTDRLEVDSCGFYRKIQVALAIEHRRFVEICSLTPPSPPPKKSKTKHLHEYENSSGAGYKV